MSDFLQFIINSLLYIGPALLLISIWKKLKIKPYALMLYCGIVWLVIGIIVSIFPKFIAIWWLSLLVWGIFVLFDILLVLNIKVPTVTRDIPARFAINVGSEIILKIQNRSKISLNILLYDGILEDQESDGIPWSGVLPASKALEISYQLKMGSRGDAVIEPTHIQYASPLKFWTRQARAGSLDETKVYPDYEPVIKFALLAMESNPAQMGIFLKNQAGMSKDFHQLREYQLGDTLSRVDWKATSRKLLLISRDYQEQRDQNLILAIDCGKRMRAMDGNIPQFDHCLNAMLLLAYVALKQGDKVGIISFGGKERYLAPVKGVHAMTAILNHLYDYQTSISTSDYSEAAERLMVHYQRRSLVVLLSNIRGEDGYELIEPMRLLRSRHLTVLANIREKEVIDQMEKPIETLDNALTYGASQVYLDDRKAIMQSLSSHGIQCVDTTAERMPVALANAYLSLRERV